MKKKLATIAIGAALANTAGAMWTEDANGNTITVIKKPLVSRQVPTQNKMRPKIQVAKNIKPVKNINSVKEVVIKDIALTAKPLEGQTQKDVDCLAYSIFREAGTLKIPAQYAVGQIHINRLKEGSWGNRLCQVVFAKAQFSWTLERKKVVWSRNQMDLAVNIARNLIDGVRVHPLDSNRILHYHATYVNPKWGKKSEVVAMAGPHIFYKDITH
jgi:hypothetical protein